MTLRLAIALSVALLVGMAAAYGQSTGQTPGGATVPGVVNYCVTGVTRSDGAFVVAPCGAGGFGGSTGSGGVPTISTTPLAVTIINGTNSAPPANVSVVGTVATSVCPANPLTKKIPPLC